MTYTKATLADLDHAETVAVATGQAALDTASETSRLAGQLDAGVGQVTESLVSQVRTMATVMRDEIERAAATLGTSDWEGRAREAAGQLEHDLRGVVNGLLSGAELDAQALRAELQGHAEVLVTGFSARFAEVLASIDLSYRSLADAERAFATNLAAADATFSAAT